MTHLGCALDSPRNVALAYGQVWGFKLMLAGVEDDEDAKEAVFDEMGDCAVCLRNVSNWLTGMTTSLALLVAESRGGDKVSAARNVRMQLAEAERQIP